MLVLADAWTWDFWLADDGESYHVFFLRASRALSDPHRRHRRAGVGHAVSDDLRTWTLLPDALVHSDPPAFDDLATWTGSVVRAPDGSWRMFYTGLSHAEGGRVQRIGAARSDDLLTWTRTDSPLVLADPRWYQTFDARGDDAGGPDQAWRDPWVFRDPGGDGWHMLVTAGADVGEPVDRGVIGHARSADLDTWVVGPPLSAAGAGFGELEVLQVQTVEGRPVLLFSCLAGWMSPARRRSGPGGVWALPCESLLGPFDIAAARPLTGPDLYAGRLAQDRDGQWVLLAFRNLDEHGAFVGGLSDPMPVTWTEDPDGGLTLARAAAIEPGSTWSPGR